MWNTSDLNLSSLVSLTPVPSDGVIVSAMRMGLIMLLAWLTISLSHKLIRTFRERLTTKMRDRESVQRAETVGRMARHAVTIVVGLLALLLILSEMGISVAPLLGAAGVAGVAIGFGAQNLVKDLFAGLSLLMENQIRQGDVITLDQHTGTVEEVTLRYVRLRDYDGNVHFVPNGSINSVVSMSRGHAFAVVNVNVSYSADIDEAMQVMADVAEQMMRDDTYRERLDGVYELAGVDQLTGWAVVLQIRLRVKPLQQWAIRRAYLRLVKQAFDQRHIAIPVQHLTLVSETTCASHDKGVNTVTRVHPFFKDSRSQR